MIDYGDQRAQYRREGADSARKVKMAGASTEDALWKCGEERQDIYDG